MENGKSDVGNAGKWESKWAVVSAFCVQMTARSLATHYDI